MNIVMNETQLYLGVVHAAESVKRTKKRMSTAGKYVPQFGVACKCGIVAVHKTNLVRYPLDIHAAVSLG
jgi:hypothetical protein